MYKEGTYQLDHNTFIAWSNLLQKVGLKNFYSSSWSDYLPGYLYILWFLAKVRQLDIIDVTLLYKLPSIISDVVTAAVIYKIVSDLKKSPKWALSAAGVYLFNPAVIANSTLWGQADSLTLLFALAAVWLLKKRPLASSVSLAVGTLIKPQAGFIAPVLLFLMVSGRFGWKKILSYIAVSLGVFVLGFAPFLKEGNLLSFVYERLAVTFNQYPYSSVNAFNFWGLWGFWQRDDIGMINANKAGFAIVSALVVWAFYRLRKHAGNKKELPYYLSAFVFASSFLFLTRMHERHLLPLLAPLAISAVFNPFFWFVYLGYSVTYVLNLSYAFSYISQDRSFMSSFWSAKAVVAANLVLFAAFCSEMFFGGGTKVIKLLKNNFRLSERKLKFPEVKISKRFALFALCGIMAFSLFSRLIFLDYPPREYFDEVYHAFTARQMLHSNPMAWEWWNESPEGFAYEWTHPPLAKLGMVASMAALGESSFGWRFPGAVLGTLCVYLVYLISKGLFKDELLALFAALVFSLDGLILVMSRIGMNDVYMLFFVLLSIHLFIKNRLFLTALSLGFALSSKWSALWAIPLIVLLHFILKRKPSPGYFWFLVLLPGVYLLSYLPMFFSGHDFSTFVEVQKQMWWYHTNLEATHAYSSSWLSWPLLLKPVYLYTSQQVGSAVSKIYALGNPFVFWFGAVSVLASFYYALVYRSKALAWVVFSYLVFFVPWSLSPRIMFLYHYLPSTAFLVISVAFVLRKNIKLAVFLLPLFLISFLYFFPHLTGMFVDVRLDETYYWFPSWR